MIVVDAFNDAGVPLPPIPPPFAALCRSATAYVNAHDTVSLCESGAAPVASDSIGASARDEAPVGRQAKSMGRPVVEVRVLCRPFLRADRTRS